MPAHHRFHPYEIQNAALMLSLLWPSVAIFLACTAKRLEALTRGRKPAARKALVTRSSAPVLSNYLLTPN